MAIQLLFCGVLLPGFIQNKLQHVCVVLIKLFLQWYNDYNKKQLEKKLPETFNVLSYILVYIRNVQ